MTWRAISVMPLYGPPRHPTHLYPRFMSNMASYDVASNICQAIGGGAAAAHRVSAAGRGLHSSTFRLNVNVFCGICWLHDFPPVC